MPVSIRALALSTVVVPAIVGLIYIVHANDALMRRSASAEADERSAHRCDRSVSRRYISDGPPAGGLVWPADRVRERLPFDAPDGIYHVVSITRSLTRSPSPGVTDVPSSSQARRAPSA